MLGGQALSPNFPVLLGAGCYVDSFCALLSVYRDNWERIKINFSVFNPFLQCGGKGIEL